MKVLIGYDGSKDAEAALADLPAAGLPANTQAKVVTVVAPLLPALPDGLEAASLREREAAALARAARRQAQELAEAAAARLRKAYPGWKVSAEAVLDHPAIGLLRAAEAWKADLVVLGSHGRSALGRFLLGSVSRLVLNHAHCDVRITRSGKTGARAPRVIVAVDGSAGSDHAVAAAAARAWPKGTRIQILAAVESSGLAGALLGLEDAAHGDRKRAHQTWVERKCASAARRLAVPGVEVATAVKSGDPRIVILREARAWDADAIFLGSRGLSGIERFLLGSVSASVSSHAPCTVEVIRKLRAKRLVRAAIRPRSAAASR